MALSRAPGAGAGREEENVLHLGPWPIGMDNLRNDAELPPDALRNAVNVDIDRDGTPRLRAGRTARAAGDAHSVWSNGVVLLAVVNNTLVRYSVNASTGALTPTTVRSGLAVDQPLAYTSVNEEVYYTNGIVTGKVVSGVAAPWGIQRPTGVPTLAAASNGGLAAGTYQVTLTYSNGNGEESGARPGVSVTVVAGQSITVAGIPQPTDATVTRIRVYRTEADGEVFYLHNVYSPGTTSATINQSATLGAQLQTMHLAPPPPGQVVEAYNGRIYTAQGPLLYYTEPLRYGAAHPKKFLWFPADISIVAAATTGLYVVADKHYYLLGNGPEDFTLIDKLPFAAVLGTSARLPYSQSHVSTRHTSKTAATREAGTVWMSVRGLVIADMQGDVRVVSEDNIAVDANTHGAALVRETNGVRQIVTTGFGAGLDSGLVAQDYLDAEVIRKS